MARVICQPFLPALPSKYIRNATSYQPVCLTLAQVTAGAHQAVSPLLPLLPDISSQQPGCFCQNTGQTMSHFSVRNPPTVSHLRGKANTAPLPLPHTPGPLPDLPLVCPDTQGMSPPQGFCVCCPPHPLTPPAWLVPSLASDLYPQVTFPVRSLC